MSLFFCTWDAVGDIAVSKLIAHQSVMLAMLAGSLLVYRTFRERYLLLWIVGWLAYFASHWPAFGNNAGPLFRTAIPQAEFVLAICLFAASIFRYTHWQKWLAPLATVAACLIAFTFVRAIYWPDSFVLRAALEIGYRITSLVAAVRLIRFRWARGEVGPWLMALGLVAIHLDWAPLTSGLPFWFNPLAQLLFGVSMLIIVMDDSKMRMRRLAVINTLTTTITRAQQHGPMMETALAELKALMRAKAAWFRLMDNDRMEIVQHIGLSPEFVRDRTAIALDGTHGEAFRDGKPVVVKTPFAPEIMRPYLQAEKFHHVVLVPVMGKKAPIGVLNLGSRRRLSYAPDEIEFLATTAHQLGLAVENLRLVEQILRSHRQWTNTFDSIQDVVLLHDSEFQIMKANLALLQRLGVAAADLTGKSCESVLPHTDGKWSGCPYCKGDDQSFQEGPDPCFGGFSMVSSSSYSEQGGKQRGTIHVAHDVTDRHLAEQKYRMLFEQVHEGVFVTTPDGKLLECNDAFVRMLGYASREELMAVNAAELYPAPEQRDAFRREVEAHNHVRNFEVTLRRKDASLLTAIESSFATRDANGNIERYQGFLLDVTEKRRAEDEIRRRNRELNALNAMAVIATQSFDLDEILNLTLRQVISLLGAETGSIYLLDLDETTFRRRAGWGQRSADRARFAEIRIPAFGELVMRSRTEVITAEYLPHLPTAVSDFVCADGLRSWIWVLLWGKDRPIGLMGISNRDHREYTSNDENLLVAIGRQLATTVEKVRLYEETCRAYEDLRRTQEQLLQSEKMSAVGQLISGVAHELNNPLTAILGYAQLLESEQLQDRAADFVRKLFKQAQRTHRVVQNLLSFARQRKPHKQQVELTKVLEETLALRDYDLKVNDVTLDRDIERNLPPVTADAHQLEQVFLNVINNAVDALLEAGPGGKLIVRMFQQDAHVHAVFHDSGPGIKEPNRIFDPFYTTKTVGKGTGLGLSICYGIVKEHGGDITARNAPEGGAIIEIRLPAAAPAAIEASQTITPKRENAFDGRILLVEEEEAVLEFERDVLAGAGAQVVAIMSAEEMKERLLKDSFDAVIVDGRLRGGSTAPELYNWIAENRPGMQRHLLFTFCNVAEPDIRDFLQQNSVPYLVKPFEVADLIAQARRISLKAIATSA